MSYNDTHGHDHGQGQDRKFLRNFAGVMVALALAGIAFGILANIVAAAG